MDKPISPGLKIAFLIHGIVGLVFGLAYLLIPQTAADLTNISLQGGEPWLRLVGAAILGFTASSWLGYMAHGWHDVKIVVQAEMLWTFLAAVLILWFTLNGTWPALGWVNFIIMALFFVAFTYFYWREETVPLPTAGPATR